MKVKNNITWEATMPMYIQILISDTYNQKQKDIVIEELMRLAKLVDELNGKEIIK